MSSREHWGDAQNILSSRANRSLALLQAVDWLAREAIKPASVLAMENHGGKTLIALVRKHCQLRQSNEARQKRMAEVPSWSPKTKATRRPVVYQALCSACHRYRGKGGNIGLNLDAYQLNNPGFIIPAVVDPNLGIREEFAGFNVITMMFNGSPGSLPRTPHALLLRDLAQNSITLPRAEIKDLKAMPVSLMPEGITDAPTDQQVRDLFAYLMGNSAELLQNTAVSLPSRPPWHTSTSIT